MNEEVRQRREVVVEDVPTANGTRHVEEVATGTTRPLGEQIVYYLSGLLLSLLAIRFVLALLGANRGNPFAGFIFGITRPFVAPFFGLFGYEMQYGVSRFEFETLVAMAIYALIAYGIVRLIQMMNRRPSTT